MEKKGESETSFYGRAESRGRGSWRLGRLASRAASPPGDLLLRVPPATLKEINYIDLRKASNDWRTVNVLEV